MKDRPLQTKIIYGPIDSRRLGRSLGVNILPTQWKVCTFDCLYCQYGWSCCQWEGLERGELGLPTPEAVAEELETALPALGPVDAITLAGNGEPTLHPLFEPIVTLTAAVRDRLAPGVPLVILSNSSTLASSDEVRRAFRYIDRPVMKLDAGSAALFDQINRPKPGIHYEAVVEALAALERVEIQSLFFEGPSSNAGAEDVEHWLAALERIRPTAVQVYSLDRTPAESRLRPLDHEALERIAASARRRLPGARVEVY